MTGYQNFTGIEDRLGIGETAPGQPAIRAEVAMSTGQQLAGSVLKPEILTERAGGQCPSGIRWAAGVDLDYDGAVSDSFKDSALVKLMTHHPEAHVANVSPATLRGHDASR
jgi:hypothetical protein